MADLDRHYEGAGQYWGVDPEVLRAVHRVEDPTDDPRARSKAGAIGHMQFMPETARSLGIDPTDPVQSIYGAARLMRENLDRYGNLPDALRAYNAGTDRARWNNDETNAYVGRVAAAYHKPETQTVAKKPADPRTDDDALDKMWGLSGEPAKTATAPAQSGPSDEELDRMWGLSAPKVSQTPRPMSAPVDTAPKWEKQSWERNALTGAERGVEDIRDSVVGGSNWLLGKAGINALQSMVDHEDAARKQYDQDYGGSLSSKLGRMGGNLAASAIPVGGAELGAARLGAKALGMLGAGEKVSQVGGALLGMGAGGATANAATDSETGQPIGQALRDGAIGGVLTGGATALAKPIARGAMEAFTGGAVSPERAALARRAEDLGIDLTAPQISTSPNMAYLSDVANGGIVSPAQRGQFTRAVSRTFGQDSDRLTPDVIDDAHNALGNRFDHVAANTIIKADNQFGSDLGAIADEARQVLPEQEVTPIVNQINNIMSKAATGEISGPQYQALTRQGAPLARAMRSNNPNVAYYAGRVRDAFDDAMERSLTANGRTDLLDELKDARRQYKNLKTIEPLAAKANEDGAISPALLQGAVNKSFKSRARRGAGDLGDLADIGQAFLKAPPNSGTAPRIGAEIALSEIPAAFMGHGLGAAGTVLGVAAGRGAAKSAARSYLNSDIVKNSILRRSEASTPAPRNYLLSGLVDAAKAGAPYSAAVPNGDQIVRNWLLGY
ncbi:lytic transglycosylase domain-containing protein [Gluconobacter sphaericus]|uniref:lytic transglycosylase domain-containing protein n=1 Tax=Gluconobacter sphaericus TaxID=574987 RepID=UPI001921B995|nr:lytic transglycosylase domain-containing protein [Gluconobacter sphaericus]QQX91340.1 lytic transglycosylase domain-containing protein [Gluconobacter sphaericus]